MERVFNFNPGPATLPLSVLEKAQKELLNYQGTGMSVIEVSHRSKEFEAIVNDAAALLKELLQMSDDYKVLFLQGGASTQFAMVPLNFLKEEETADYITTGIFGEKAYKEAVKIGSIHTAASTKDTNHDRIPTAAEINFSPSPSFVHITSNNTIFGTQWKDYSVFNNLNLVADMSSDILCGPLDVSRFALIYAGAQKNLGPAGVTVVIIRKDMLEKVPSNIPSMFRYDLHAENNSLYNTPPSFSIYMVKLVLEWLKEQGGLAKIKEFNENKAALVYEAIDQSNGFYRGHAQKEYRSTMNVTFRLPDEEMEKKFVTEAASHGLVNLKGHRSVGGIRTSIYNAMPFEGCEKLASFMKEFNKKN
ncbi:3-phosphoserine/phosphohydroxythreonine transaminase [Candidatus Contubernalis alkaliaceticus]|uniref:3-phosphoserine/phosphohydroxythreonine transaminase n=1 Tax=Candidatus Contubernalis alkaliaceticus TaxID=338645 RepID=UPI001F4BEAAD|nr:3-phosphoserine/phosphohydroxythreonine transaminase [Candidatus Contubernalis alkalaceticus]UNC92972.1 3-phosphoserine/phosphohydroxythreonine transaminase [Candidatus Contubernalis alkalaceticus]